LNEASKTKRFTENTIGSCVLPERKLSRRTKTADSRKIKIGKRFGTNFLDLPVVTVDRYLPPDSKS